jgi:alpha-galactosidase
VAPEQSASWAYPQPEYSDELNAFTLVNALLGRIHLSGRVDLLNEHQRALVKAGLDAYKGYREQLAAALPIWPLGLPRWDDEWVAAGLDLPNGDTLLAVWRRGGADTVRLPGLGGRIAEVIYPTEGEAGSTVRAEGADLIVELAEAPAARLLRLAAHP